MVERYRVGAGSGQWHAESLLVLGAKGKMTTASHPSHFYAAAQEQLRQSFRICLLSFLNSLMIVTRRELMQCSLLISLLGGVSVYVESISSDFLPLPSAQQPLPPPSSPASVGSSEETGAAVSPENLQSQSSGRV